MASSAVARETGGQAHSSDARSAGRMLAGGGVARGADPLALRQLQRSGPVGLKQPSAEAEQRGPNRCQIPTPPTSAAAATLNTPAPPTGRCSRPGGGLIRLPRLPAAQTLSGRLPPLPR